MLTDVRRMNVALTRAKSSVFVLGNAPSLERSDAFWKRIVQDARERSRLTNVSSRCSSVVLLFTNIPVRLGRRRVLHIYTICTAKSHRSSQTEARQQSGRRPFAVSSNTQGACGSEPIFAS